MGRFIVTTAAFILIGLFIYSFLKLYERVETTTDTGYSLTALQNPYLAAERYLKNKGLDVDSDVKLSIIENLEPYSTLLLDDAQVLLTSERIDITLEWVNQGGHLILFVDEADINIPNQLIERLGIDVIKTNNPYTYSDYADCPNGSDRIYEINPDLFDGDKSAREILEQINQQIEAKENNNSEATEANCIPETALTKLSFSGKKPLQTLFIGNTGLTPYLNTGDNENTRIYSARDSSGVRLMQIKRGNGLINVLTSNKIWKSQHIGLFDNAYLLWHLADKNRPFYFLLDNAMPSLFTLIWRYGSEFVLTAALFIVLWVWHMGRRNRPAHEPLITERRNLQEYLSARAGYLWENNSHQTLITPLLNEISQQATLRLPNFQRAGQFERNQMIAEHCKIDLEQVNFLFNNKFNSRPQASQRAISTAKEIRNRL